MCHPDGEGLSVGAETGVAACVEAGHNLEVAVYVELGRGLGDPDAQVAGGLDSEPCSIVAEEMYRSLFELPQGNCVVPLFDDKSVRGACASSGVGDVEESLVIVVLRSPVADG